MPAGGALTAGAIAAPVIGGIFGASASSKARKQAAAAAAAAFAQLQAVGMPPDLSKEIIRQQFQSQGTLTPEMEEAIELEGSQVSQIQEDPSLKNAQMEALQTLGQVSRGGLRAEDRAAYNQLRNKVQQDAEAKRQQLLQSMAARGMGGSGAELLAQLQSQQASADTASAGADSLAAQASQNALAALTQRANLAGSVRGQDLTAEEMKARAIDERNKFLYENSVARQRQNIERANQAQAGNLQSKQNIANANVAQTNEEKLRQAQAERDLFNDKLNLAQAKANALNNQASAAIQQGQQQANMYSGIGAALGQGLGAYASSQNKPAAAQPTQTSGYTSGMADALGRR